MGVNEKAGLVEMLKQLTYKWLGTKYGPEMFLTSFMRFTIIRDYELIGNDKYYLYTG